MSNDLNIDFFKVNYNQLTPKQGRVLIAQPSMIDQYFKRTVILLVEHNKKNGTVGFVLNKTLDFSLSELLPDFPDLDAKISIGGPVSPNSIHFIHSLGKIIPDTTLIAENLYWGGSFEALKPLIISGKVKPHQIRFFVGYSGWGTDQLERELREESWVVTNIPAEQIMSGSDDLWINTVQQMGVKFKSWTLYPENPSLN